MAKVLVLAPSRKTRGGINSVVNAYRSTGLWQEFRCKWIPTYIDRKLLLKLAFFAVAFLRCLVLMPFYDIVHIHFSLPSSAKRKFFFFRMAKFYRRKVVIHLHCGDQLPAIWSPLYQRMFSEADVAIVLSDAARKRVESFMGHCDHLRVVYNPCPIVSHVTPYSHRQPELLVAGTLNRNKAYQDIIPAWGRVAGEFPDWKLVFAGNGEVEAARTLAEQNGVADRTVFLGWVDKARKDEVFNRSSALCMASYKEGFPMAVLDAFSYGLPVISSLTGGMSDLVAADPSSVLTFTAGNVDELADRMRRMMEDPAMRERMAEASLGFSRGQFSLDKIVGQIKEVYLSCSDEIK